MKAALALVALLALAAPAAACPSCAETVADDATVDRSGGFNGAIWVMVAAAVTGVGGVAKVVLTRPDLKAA